MRLLTPILTVMLLAAPAAAHSQSAVRDWKTAWTITALHDGFMTRSELSSYLSFTSKHSAPKSRGMGGNVEQWRPLVQTYFSPDDVDWAMRVMGCESGGNPDAKNPRSTASGLFQHLGSLWPGRSSAAGWAGSSIFDPTANVAVAAWLVYQGGGKGHWNASKHCWG